MGDDAKCYDLASNDSNNGKGQRTRDSDDDDDDEDGGLTVSYDGGESCMEQDNDHYSLDIQVFCTDDDDNNRGPQIIKREGCRYTVRVYDEQGCYVFDTNPLIRFLKKYSYVLGAFLILIGFVVALFGKPLFKPTICLVGTLVFMIALSLFIFSIFFTRNTPDWAGWLVFGISLVIGSIVGLILAKLSKLGVAVLAGWGGFCLGMILYSSFMYRLDGDKHILFWIFNISLGVIAGILSIFLFEHAIIISTSIVGSYAFVRGISFYAGGYPSELDLPQIIKYEGLDGIDPRFYGYMAGFLVASIICIVLQYKFWMKDKNHSYKHPYHYRR